MQCCQVDIDLQRLAILSLSLYLLKSKDLRKKKLKLNYFVNSRWSKIIKNEMNSCTALYELKSLELKFL